ncbi:MAG: flagellar hook-associated protein FlgK [Bacillaceae bacterium]|nr:flagellar hook-associated protein FlgK [Bacillaceae bacterium]
MRSTFHGLEVSKRALFTQQNALYTTGHNISNANTEGYTRQRVNMTATNPLERPAWNRSTAPGQLGQGVEVQEIQRIREEFLDIQFRGENKKLGYYEMTSDTLDKIQRILNEPSDDGLQSVIDQFWQSWEDLSKEPSSQAAREVVIRRGIAVAETFSYINQSLQDLQQDLNDVVRVKVSEINSYARQISELNQQITKSVSIGDQPNDLLDKRDLLLDKLSELVNVQTVKYDNGSIDVLIGDNQTLVEGQTAIPVTADPDPANNGFYAVKLGGGDLELESGSLYGTIQSRGYVEDGQPKGIIVEFQHRINQLAVHFTQELNAVHESGLNLDDVNGGKYFGATDPALQPDSLKFFVDRSTYEATKDETPPTFIDPTSAFEIMVNPEIQNNTNKVAAATPSSSHPDGSSYAGDGSNALKIAELKQLSITIEGENTTFDDYYRYTLSRLGVQAQEAIRMRDNTELLLGSVEEKRQSVSGVSLDEEMSNMIKFQHAYNAAARMVTALDEVLDKVINGMGVVGR